jgi:ABC-type cobalamin/Fe3+-siderophores transport system ATPase subunit
MRPHLMLLFCVVAPIFFQATWAFRVVQPIAFKTTRRRAAVPLFALPATDGSSSSTTSTSPSSPPVLTVENLSCTHNGGETYQLKDVSYNLQRGRKVALIGRNGSGKSSFLKIIHESFLKQQSSAPTATAAAAYRDETNYRYTGKVSIPKTVKVSLVDQEPPMPSDVTVGDAILGIQKKYTGPLKSSTFSHGNNVMDVVRNYRIASQHADGDPDAFVAATAAMERLADGGWNVLTRAEEIATRLKVHHLQDQPLSSLSGGERKRVALCAALIEEPDGGLMCFQPLDRVCVCVRVCVILTSAMLTLLHVQSSCWMNPPTTFPCTFFFTALLLVFVRRHGRIRKSHPDFFLNLASCKEPE